nr:hypothetical protein [Nonomuraea sp. SYSU D8015]
MALVVGEGERAGGGVGGGNRLDLVDDANVVGAWRDAQDGRLAGAASRFDRDVHDIVIDRDGRDGGGDVVGQLLTALTEQRGVDHDAALDALDAGLRDLCGEPTKLLQRVAADRAGARRRAVGVVGVGVGVGQEHAPIAAQTPRLQQVPTGHQHQVALAHTTPHRPRPVHPGGEAPVVAERQHRRPAYENLGRRPGVERLTAVELVDRLSAVQGEELRPPPRALEFGPRHDLLDLGLQRRVQGRTGFDGVTIYEPIDLEPPLPRLRDDIVAFDKLGQMIDS